MVAHTLSARKRDALRLDLEDQQRSLIDDIWHLSHDLETHCDGRCTVAATGAVADAIRTRLCCEVERLHEINDALRRLPRIDYGVCATCGGQIAFQILAADPTARCCGQCSSDA